MAKFKVGDIVRGTSDKYGITNKNMNKGRVTSVYTSYGDEMIDVKVLEMCEKPFNPKEYYVSGRPFQGLDASCFELVKEKPIVIYRKGSEVIAIDKNTGKKGIAKCNPADEFDFKIGSKLAFERLMGEESEDETIRVGDLVTIENMGYQYTTYNCWSGIGKEYVNFSYASKPDAIEISGDFEVLNIAKHDKHDAALCLIRPIKSRYANKNVYIFGIDGLKKVKKGK